MMWDHYLLERDPFLVFFLALVMVVNTKSVCSLQEPTWLLSPFPCRELLLEGSPMSQEELCSTLSSIPGQLSAEDIEDFFSLAQYYASRTPQSFRKVGISAKVKVHPLDLRVSRPYRTTTVCCLAAAALWPLLLATCPTLCAYLSACKKYRR